MPNLPKLHRRAFIAAGAGLGAIGMVKAAQAVPYYDFLGHHMPAIDLPMVGGGRLNAAAFAGKTAILHFWGLWCPSCMAEITDVARLPALLANDHNIVFQTVHMSNRYGNYANLEHFFRTTGLSFPVALDAANALDDPWHIKFAPTFLIIDDQGIIRDFCNELDKDGGPGISGLVRRARAIAAHR